VALSFLVGGGGRANFKKMCPPEKNRIDVPVANSHSSSQVLFMSRKFVQFLDR